MSAQPPASTTEQKPTSLPAPAPTPSTVPAQPTAASAPIPKAGSGKVLLAVAAIAFVGWIGWLSVTALTKTRAPIVSHAQAAASKFPVRAKLTTGRKDLRAEHDRKSLNNAKSTLHGDDGKPAFIVTVVEPLTANGPAKDTKIGVANLPGCTGYNGEGEYLLLLVKDGDATIDGNPSYFLVGQQRSPASDLDNVGQPMIYPWNEKTEADLRKQLGALFR